MHRLLICGIAGVERIGLEFPSIILLDYSTMVDRCFVSGCVFICVLFSGCGLGGVGGGSGGRGRREDSTWGER